jgi:hypothetical protein
MSSSVQREWIQRVLGIALPGATALPDATAIRAAVAAWRQASETVDGQVAQLQTLLQRSDDPELREIGEFGMAALSGGNRTRLIAAAMELERADPPPPALLKRVATIAAKFRAHLASDPKVRGFDSNPFGVPVSIRATLEPALQQIETAVSGEA